MKTSLLLGAAFTLAASHLLHAGTNLDDPTFDTMPTTGISVFTSPAAEGALALSIAPENVHAGSGCLEIALPAPAYASVSFPLQQGSTAMDIQFAYRVEAAEGSEVKIGIQSFTMENGFHSVDFKPLVAPDQIGADWKVFRGRAERAEGATHWQVSIAINGPATVWIDELEALPE